MVGVSLYVTQVAQMKFRTEYFFFKEKKEEEKSEYKMNVPPCFLQSLMGA